MALVGNGAELEADEVLAGGECGLCPWSPAGMGQGPAPSVSVWDWQPPAWRIWQGLRMGVPVLGRSVLAGVRGVSAARSGGGAEVRGAGTEGCGDVGHSVRSAGGWVRGRSSAGPAVELFGASPGTPGFMRSDPKS